MPPEDADHIIHDVGRKIAEFRRAAGMTQEQAAERLEMSLKGYQQVERGLQNLTLRTMVKLAGMLDVRTIDLLATPASREVKRGRPRKIKTEGES